LFFGFLTIFSKAKFKLNKHIFISAVFALKSINYKPEHSGDVNILELIFTAGVNISMPFAAQPQQT